MDIQALSHWLQRPFRHVSSVGKRVALTFCDEGISLVALHTPQGETIAVQKTLFQACQPSDELEVILREMVAKSQLNGYPCSLVLQPSEYRLILLDGLDVPDEELAQAARWRVQTMHDIPADDAAVAAFVVHHHVQMQWRKKVYVVVSRISDLQVKHQLIRQAGLALDTVDIAECALRNLVCFMHKTSEPIALLAPQKKHCLLLIMGHNQIFLARYLDVFTYDTVDMDGLGRELQRSYDYCLSQLGLPRPQRLLFAPIGHETQIDKAQLAQHLGHEVQFFDVCSGLRGQITLSEPIQPRCFVAMGGALRDRMDRSDNAKY